MNNQGYNFSAEFGRFLPVCRNDKATIFKRIYFNWFYLGADNSARHHSGGRRAFLVPLRNYTLLEGVT
jgi:hypothetical protein